MPDALAFDIGGTKTLAALVRGAEVIAEAQVPTPRGAGPDAWLDAAAEAARPWAGRFDRAGAAVTGAVDGGLWRALNPGILPVPDGFPIEAALAARLGVPVRALNDAQAAAWGEHRFGAGTGAGDMAFVTISTGIGGGIVAGGRLLTGRGGLAGHLGVTGMVLDDSPDPIEERISGRWIAAEAARAGHPMDAAGVFACPDPWAERIVATSAARAARLLRNLQLILAPERVVVGGGIGLAPGYLDRLRACLAHLPEPRRPVLVPAALGTRAGVVGAADLSQQDQQRRSA